MADELPDIKVPAEVARYFPYLYEVRKRLLFIFAVFFVGWAIGFYYYQPLVLFILKLYNLSGVNIAFTSPFQFINLAINAGIVTGLILALPLIVYQILAFLKPALHPKEFRTIVMLLPLNFLFFIGGFVFGTWIMKFVVIVSSQQTDILNIQNLWDINNFLSQIFMTAFLLGLVFQFPLILTMLMRCGILHHTSVSKQRIPIYVFMAALVVFLPPTDLLSLFLMFFPLAFIFEVTLLLNRKSSKKTTRNQ